MDPNLVKKITSSKHRDYEKYVDTWKKNELYYLGDEAVYNDLKKYIWELAGDTQAFDQRKLEAVYYNFPEWMMERFMGMLMANSPTPNFGTLGELSDDGQITSDADAFFRNTDGVGQEARGWDMFWTSTMSMAWPTAFRWILTEGPDEAPRTRADEKKGQRPYLVDFSPVSVPNWEFRRGELMWWYAEIEGRKVHVENGDFKDEKVKHKYVHVREGYQGLGPDFERGGWWMFDDDGLLIKRDDKEMEGDWSKTNGQIPLTRCWYERKNGSLAPTSSEHMRRLSLQYMNLRADGVHDSHESCSRQKLITVDLQQWESMNTPAEQTEGHGSKKIPPIYGQLVPIPASADVDNKIFDSGSVSAHENNLAQTELTMKDIMQFFLRELTTSPDASGEAKKVESIHGNSPRLVHMSNNLEEAQTASQRFTEMRWGRAKPTGTTTWDKKFDLRTVMEKASQALKVMAQSKGFSPTLAQNLVLGAVQELGFTFEDAGDFDKIKNELASSMQASAERESQLQAFRQATIGTAA